MREIDSNLRPGSCKFAAHSSLFHVSIMGNTLAAKKQFGIRKWWGWAHRGCTRVFFTIPSFRIDHSQITELFIVNTCHLTSCLWYRPYIIYQLPCADWNIIILPAWGTAVIQHLDHFSGQSPPALAGNNSLNSFFNFFEPLPFILLNHRAREHRDWKEPPFAHQCCPTSFREQTFLDP